MNKEKIKDVLAWCGVIVVLTYLLFVIFSYAEETLLVIDRFFLR
mgnify:CR=1 FL=1